MIFQPEPRAKWRSTTLVGALTVVILFAETRVLAQEHAAANAVREVKISVQPVQLNNAGILTGTYEPGGKRHAFTTNVHTGGFQLAGLSV